MSDPLVEEVDFLVAQARMKRDLLFTKSDGFWRERVGDLVELVERAVKERDEALMLAKEVHCGAEARTERYASDRIAAEEARDAALARAEKAEAELKETRDRLRFHETGVP